MVDSASVVKAVVNAVDFLTDFFGEDDFVDDWDDEDFELELFPLVDLEEATVKYEYYILK